MLKRTLLLITLSALLIYMVTINEAKKKKKLRQGPKGMSRNYSTNCKEFSKYGRFNPYSVLNHIWFVFFYWSAHRPTEMYRFFIPTANHTQFLHKLFDGKVTKPVNWTARQVIMQARSNRTWLLVERGDRGQYWSYLFAKVKKEPIQAQDIRLRQVDNGRLLGLMECQTEHLSLMSRINEIPLQSKIPEDAARFGFRARRGKSYLYQGHEWMPIPEADENDFFIVRQELNKTMTDEKLDLNKLELPDAPTGTRKNCQSNADSSHRCAGSSETDSENESSEFEMANSIEESKENVISEEKVDKNENMEDKVKMTTQSSTAYAKSECGLKEDTFYQTNKVTLKDVQVPNKLVTPPSDFQNKLCETNKKKNILTIDDHRQQKTSNENKIMQTTDMKDITDDVTAPWENIQSASHTANLLPVENRIFVEHVPENVNNDAIPSPSHLPSKCYEMELVEDSVEVSPANLPAILNQIEGSRKVLPSQTQ